MRKEIACPQVQQDYAKYFNGVDRNDRDSSNYTVSLQTNRWYLRYYFYLIDRVVHSMYVLATNIAEQGLRDGWGKYLKKEGHYQFQIDLAMALIDMGIKEDWKDPFEDKDKPKWMRKEDEVPCQCRKCFFCCIGKTTGITSVRVPTGIEQKSDIPEGCNKIPKVFKDRKSDYYRLCFYRLGQQQPNIKSFNEKRKRCAMTNAGCHGCNTLICDECYEDYEHNMVNNKSVPIIRK
jgi:hypothetical protein